MAGQIPWTRGPPDPALRAEVVSLGSNPGGHGGRLPVSAQRDEDRPWWGMVVHRNIVADVSLLNSWQPGARQTVRVAGVGDALSDSSLGALGGKEEAKSAVAYLLAISR